MNNTQFSSEAIMMDFMIDLLLCLSPLQACIHDVPYYAAFQTFVKYPVLTDILSPLPIGFSVTFPYNDVRIPVDFWDPVHISV